MQQRLDPRQQFFLDGYVCRDLCRVDQSIDFRMREAPEVVASVDGVAVKGVGQVESCVDRPSTEQGVEVVSQNASVQAIELLAAQARLNCDPAQLLLDQHGRVHPERRVGVGGELERERPAVAVDHPVAVAVLPAFCREQLASRGRIVGPGSKLAVVGPDRRDDRGSRDPGSPEPERVHQRLAVDGQGQSPSDLRVVERRSSEVPGDEVVLPGQIRQQANAG